MSLPHVMIYGKNDWADAPEASVGIFTIAILLFIKPGARGLRPRAPGFLKLLWFAYGCVCLCVCVCVSASEGINNQWHDMV